MEELDVIRLRLIRQYERRERIMRCIEFTLLASIVALCGFVIGAQI